MTRSYPVNLQQIFFTDLGLLWNLLEDSYVTVSPTEKELEDYHAANSYKADYLLPELHHSGAIQLSSIEQPLGALREARALYAGRPKGQRW